MALKVLWRCNPIGIIESRRLENESFIAAIDNPTVNLQVIEVLKNTSQI
jgi:hypothetical protein